MIIWEDYRWIIWLGVIIVVVILLDEYAYGRWKRANPGAIFSHLKDKTIPLVDPSNPPFTYNPHD